MQRRLYNRRVHGDMHKVGDHVWLHTMVLSRGNTKKCIIHGLAHIVSSRGCQTYLSDPATSGTSKTTSGSFNRLKPCGHAVEDSLPAEDSSVSRNLSEHPVTGQTGVVEPEDIPAQSEPHQPLPPVPSPKANISIIDDTLAVTANPLTDSVIWFLSESTKSPGRTLQRGELCNRAVLLVFMIALLLFRRSHDMLLFPVLTYEYA